MSQTVRAHTRRTPKPRQPPSEQTKLCTSVTVAVSHQQKPDDEAYARALVPIIRRWCHRPLEVSRWLVRFFESEP